MTDHYIPPQFEYFVLSRWNMGWRFGDRNIEYQIISVLKGNDPLYGYGTWDLFSGPFDTWDEAERTSQ